MSVSSSLINMLQDTHNVMRMIERLDLWSLIHVAIMMVIGLTQVQFINDEIFGTSKIFFFRFTW